MLEGCPRRRVLVPVGPGDVPNTIAAPVGDATGAVIGAVSVTALKVKSDLADLERHDLSRLLATTANISAELGWRPPAP